MSSVSSILGTTETGTPEPTGSAEPLGRDTFLKLLTTQLQHQDPLNPMSSDEFVAQLATFTSVEELMGIQDSLEAVYLGIASMNNASMASLLGTEVVAVGDGFSYDGEGAQELHFDAQEPAHSATLMIYDEDGDLVATRELGALEQGEGVVSWDGQTTDGSAAEAGQYTFSIAAFDSEGNPVEVEEHVVGTVTEMDYSSGTPQPSVDGVVVALSDILVLAASDEGDP